MNQLLGFLLTRLPLAIALLIATIGAYMLSTSNRWSAPHLSGLVFLLLGLERLVLPYLFEMAMPQVADDSQI